MTQVISRAPYQLHAFNTLDARGFFFQGQKTRRYAIRGKRFQGRIILIPVGFESRLSKSHLSHVETCRCMAHRTKSSRDFVVGSSASRPKNQPAKTFSSGILVRSTCGKSTLNRVQCFVKFLLACTQDICLTVSCCI